MATIFNTRVGLNQYSLQFETDNEEKFLFVEKAAKRAMNGDLKEVDVVFCGECEFADDKCPYEFVCTCPYNGIGGAFVTKTDYCSSGKRKENKDDSRTLSNI